MKRISAVPLLFALVLEACSNNVNITPVAVTETAPPTIPISTETAPATDTAIATERSVVTETPASSPEAVVNGIDNDVSARALFSEDFSPASIGLNILPGGGVQTGTDGRVRIDLLPEGAIIRAGPNSSLNIIEMTTENGQPKTTIELLFGKIFILLKGGSLDIRTALGVASGQDSLMRVEYDLQKKLLKASCLDGACTLKNKNGDVVELTAGEFSFIDGDQSPVQPKTIYREEIQEWLDDVPELPYFLAQLPDPKGFPPQNPAVGLPTPTKRPKTTYP